VFNHSRFREIPTLLSSKAVWLTGYLNYFVLLRQYFNGNNPRLYYAMPVNMEYGAALPADWPSLG
jgi:hypothetical protein